MKANKIKIFTSLLAFTLIWVHLSAQSEFKEYLNSIKVITLPFEIRTSSLDSLEILSNSYKDISIMEINKYYNQVDHHYEKFTDPKKEIKIIGKILIDSNYSIIAYCVKKSDKNCKFSRIVFFVYDTSGIVKSNILFGYLEDCPGGRLYLIGKIYPDGDMENQSIKMNKIEGGDKLIIDSISKVTYTLFSRGKFKIIDK